MPVALLALTISAFAIGATEFVGLLVSLYALSVVIGAPLLTALTRSRCCATARAGRIALIAELVAMRDAGVSTSACICAATAARSTRRRPRSPRRSCRHSMRRWTRPSHEPYLISNQIFLSSRGVYFISGRRRNASRTHPVHIHSRKPIMSKIPAFGLGTFRLQEAWPSSGQPP